MAVSGTKPLPLALALVQGRPTRKMPKPGTMMQPPLSNELPPPEHLSTEAKIEWRRVIAVLSQLQVMTSLDSGTLAAYCEAYGRWVQAERGITAMAAKDKRYNGLLVKSVGGSLKQNPLLILANKAMSDMVKYAVELGMTPSARTRVQKLGAGIDANPFEAFSKPARKSGT